MGDELIICTIDGQEVFCEEDWTIHRAAKSINIDIPVLCYHPEISIIGSCRICVVEIAGEKLLYPSCSTPVKNGMEIITNSPRIKNARLHILEMLLSAHYGDCLTCDASGECLLEKYAYEFGATGTLYERNIFNKITHGIDDNNPLISLDRGKCILCGRCVRVCNEWVHRNAITFVEKGEKTMISTLYDKGLSENDECIFCGNCINVCPTGALSEKSAIRAGRFSEVKKINTICPFCGVGCGVVLYVKDNKIIKSRGNSISPVSHGRLCIKGQFGMDFANSKERLKNPLIKNESGVFQEVELIDALLYIKDKIENIKAKNGEFAGLSSSKCTNEDNYVFQKFMRVVLKTDNIDNCTRICHSPTVSGLFMTLGTGGMTNPIEDIDHVDCFLIIGSNMTSTHPVISWKVINRIKQGALLILIDPRKTPLSKYATLHLQINPGTDLHLINSMIKIILDEHLHSGDMIKNRTVGFDEFEQKLNSNNLDELVNVTGIPLETIRLAARLFAINGSSSIFYAMGVTQHNFGTDNVIGISNLALITGKVGIDYTGINPLRGQNNVQGACDMGALTGTLPGYKNIENEEDRNYYNKKWNTILPEKKGMTLIEIMKSIENDKINFLYIMGENPVLTDPDSNSTIKALEKVEFLVVQDIFMTETAKYADIILPSACFSEKEGTFTNTERRIQKVNKACDTPSENVYEDWKIITKLAELFGFVWGYDSWIDVFDEIKNTVDIYSHIEPLMLEKKEFFWPHDESGNSIKRLHQGIFEKGKAEIIYVDPPNLYETNDNYPYLLIIGRLYEHFHTGNMTRKSFGISKLQPEPFVFINPKDALKLKVRNDDLLTISSQNGKVKMKCKISLEVKKGNLFTTFHFWEAAINKLTDSINLDKLSKMASLKVIAVNLTK